MLRTTAPLIGALALIGFAVRYQGRITEWKDDRGFGFITPNGGGPTVFVHIKSFSTRSRRPVGSELVTYEVTSGVRGGAQAVKVQFVGEKRKAVPTTAAGPGVGALAFAAAFLAFLLSSVATGRLHYLFLPAYIVASCLAYMTYAFDKAASMQGKWRTEESALHLVSLLGGWPGAMLAQRMFRHKTRKRSFQVTYWLTVALNCAALGWVLYPEEINAIFRLAVVA